ncbi:MAG: elongation factor G [Clostridia bacterium]|nr:elongation factor G [Clostridia bacterium]
MKAYLAKDMRNVCILGHGGSGKTSLTESMLFLGGGTDRLGKVLDGNTVSDYDAEEIKRKISVSTSVAPLEWKNTKINILDTPGFLDFSGQVLEATRVADGAIIVVAAKAGVQVGTEFAWKYTTERNIPKIIFVSKMEEENANYLKVLDDLKANFGKTVAPFYFPILEDDKFKGYVNIIKMEGRLFENDKIVDVPVPENMLDLIEPARQMILEAVAETDEELMEKYFNGEEFTAEEIARALRKGVENNEITPVLCGSSFTIASIRKLLDAILDYLPSPDEIAPMVGADGESIVNVKTEDGVPLAATVFKTIADPFVGKLSFVRLYSGHVRTDATIYNSTQGVMEKISKLYIMHGKKQEEVDILTAGDIGAIPKLQYTNTGDTLCSKVSPVQLTGIEFPAPQLAKTIRPAKKGDEEKISTALARLREEDKTISIEINNETHETILRGMGDLHIEIIVSKLKEKFKVDVELADPKIAYREAIRRKVKVEGKHKKQSGGHGQYGHVWIEFEPVESDSLVFEEQVFGGSVPKNYFPAIEKGLRESCLNGVLAGYPVVNLKATLLDGSYHPVDSSEMAFKMAASLAFKSGLAQANPVLLEPVDHVEVFVPDSYMGDVIGDINKRRGRVLGMAPVNGEQQITAEVPASELSKYATDLRSMTQGRGRFTRTFERYEDAPPHIVEKVVAEAAKNKED